MTIRLNYQTKYTALFICLVLLTLLGLFVGTAGNNYKEIFSGLLNFDDSIAHTIVWDIRLPRVAVSMLAGGCLGLAGVLVQLSTRSELGDPNLFGIGGGAAIFLASVYAGIVSCPDLVVWIGCLASSVLIGWILCCIISSPDVSPIKFVIMGIAVGALTVSIGISIVSYGRVFPIQLIGLVAGSFTSSNWNIFWYLLITLGVGITGAKFLSKSFYPVMLGDVLSKSLGVDPIRNRYLTMSLVGVLTGASVYAAGMIGFVGLIAPHMSRKLLGNSLSHLIFGSTILGALVTLGSDQISRLLFAPTEFPVGMTTTIVGAPLIIYLALKMK